VALALGLCPGAGPPARAQAPPAHLPADEPLARPGGPYRGRVVDLATGRGVPAAAVLLLWEKHGAATRQAHAIREAVTNLDGAFVVAADDIERAGIPHIGPPRILVYRPGYTTYPSVTILPEPHTGRFGAPYARVRQAGHVVTLRPLTRPEDRLEALTLFTNSVTAWTDRAPDIREPLNASHAFMWLEIEYLATTSALGTPERPR
jgi:hypothetical protein